MAGLGMGNGIADLASVLQMGMCMHGFSGSGGTKEFGYLMQASCRQLQSRYFALA